MRIWNFYLVSSRIDQNRFSAGTNYAINVNNLHTVSDCDKKCIDKWKEIMVNPLIGSVKLGL
jgi:hypothetical protein